MTQAILFDLDGTLVDDGPNWRQSVSQTIDSICRLHQHLDRAELAAAYEAVSGAIWNEVKDASSAPWGNVDDEVIVSRVWRDTLGKVAAASDDTVDRAARTYLRHRTQAATPFDDAADCLSLLRDDYKLGIVTNGSAAIQQPKIESAGLAPYFTVTATTDLGCGKPQPEIFIHALGALDTEPGSAIYVGDSISWDVGGANNAGMVSVWLNRNNATRKQDDPTPDAEIASLTELPDLVAGLPAAEGSESSGLRG